MNNNYTAEVVTENKDTIQNRSIVKKLDLRYE